MSEVTATDAPSKVEADTPSLKRTLGFWDAMFFGIGTMLGAGVYAIIGEAAAYAGGMLWLSFVLAATAALFTAFSYCEFVSRFPDAGGSFEYIKQSLGHRVAYAGGVLIFFTGIVAAAAIAISFGEYLGRLLEMPGWIAVVGIITIMGAVNIVGVQSSSGFNAVATTITEAGLIGVISFAIPDWPNAKLLELPENGGFGLLAASALIFFSFVGFEDLVKMAEETENPRRVLPKALITSWGIVLAIYILVAISAVAVLGASELAESDGPLSAVMESKTGRYGALTLTVVALFATSKTILSNLLGTSRLLYDIARDSKAGWLRRLTHIVSGLGTPVWAIVLVTLLAIGFGLIGDLTVVASISNVFIMTVFATVNFSLIVWRLRNPSADPAPFMVRGSVGNVPIFPVLGLVMTLGLLGLNLYNITR